MFMDTRPSQRDRSSNGAKMFSIKTFLAGVRSFGTKKELLAVPTINISSLRDSPLTSFFR